MSKVNRREGSRQGAGVMQNSTYHDGANKNPTGQIYST